MRTITQRTTLPFLIAESGAASFTAAVTTSPRPARNPRSPPRGKMHESLRAPLLSATSRIVLIPIMVYPSKLSKNRPGKGPQPPSDFDVQIGRLSRPDQCGAPDHIAQAPAFQLAHRTAFNDSHHIAHARRVCLIMRIK